MMGKVTRTSSHRLNWMGKSKSLPHPTPNGSIPACAGGTSQVAMSGISEMGLSPRVRGNLGHLNAAP